MNRTNISRYAVGLLLLQWVNSPALAQQLVESETTYVVAGANRSATPMASWRKRAALQSAVGVEAVRKAPRQAVRYDVKTVSWPSATVKVLTFRKADGGVLHALKEEKLIYVLQGSLQTTVGDQAVTLAPGDVASLPSGMLANPGAPTDTVVLAWTVASLTPGATPTVVRGAATARQNSGQLSIQRYEFSGNSVRSVGLAKGLKTNPNSAKTDSLIYVTRGPMRFTQNGQEFTVTAGDFIREVAGLMHNWDVTEDSAFVTTSALPVGSGPIDPSKATDRPN